MQVLEALNISHDYGVRPLFDSLEAVLEEGEKIGLVGPNGCGKSTLLRIFAGLEQPLAGQVTYTQKVNIAFLAQEPQFPPGTTIYAALEEGLAELAALREEYGEIAARLKKRLDPAARAELNQRAQKLHDILGTMGAWDLTHRIEEMVTRLRLPAPETVLDNQSGGIIKRAALGKVLLAEPKLLFLDEPTNHLDTDTVAWLERRLSNFRGTLVLVTHDRYFLEAVVQRIVEIDCGRLKNYPGNYTAYLEAKRREWELMAHADEKRARLLAREIEWLKQGVRARTTKQKARIERIRKLERIRPARRDKPVELLFDPQKRLGHTILKAHRLCKTFNTRRLIEDFSMELLGGERIGIIGPNGCGKTTLIRMFVGQLEPDSGYVKEGVHTRIAYFDQKREQLDPQATIWDSVAPGGDHVLVSSQRLHKKAFLQSFLFPPEVQRLKVGLLSGGERNRLLLAKLMLAGANVLVLDEPTNDLDLETLQVLEEQLKSFKGSLIVVTHDRYFLDKVVEEIYAFEEGGRIRHYPGNYSYYLECREEEKTLGREAAERRKDTTAPGKPKRQGELHYLEKKELESIEGRIVRAEEELSLARAKLEDPAIAADAEALAKAYAELRRLEQEVNRLFERWDTLEQKRTGRETSP
ncbi:MAG TPA: ABC-F family ATP-binding cassette domain-containing protein [archaeon]|nr:ABC-F family ATP-binding cassette domain-containing protein [archaeon]